MTNLNKQKLDSIYNEVVDGSTMLRTMFCLSQVKQKATFLKFWKRKALLKVSAQGQIMLFQTIRGKMMIWKAKEMRKVLGRDLYCNCKEGELLLFKVLSGQHDSCNVEVLVCIRLPSLPKHLI